MLVLWQNLREEVLSMKKSKFPKEQIAFALRQAETGTRVAEVCRKMGISEMTFYRWMNFPPFFGQKSGASKVHRSRALSGLC
jgi:DNA invertase Pin-like site-specific DNA recombinase